MARARQEGAMAMDPLSAGERTGTSGMSQAEIRRRMGIDFEARNARDDVERWSGATDEERVAELRECVRMTEALNDAAGHGRDTEPKPTFPKPRQLSDQA